MDQAELSNLHQLPVGNALRVRGAWNHPIEYQGKPPSFGGWRLAAKGTQGDGTQYPSRNPSRMFRFQALTGCYGGVLGKLSLDFRPWKFFLVSGHIEPSIEAGYIINFLISYLQFFTILPNARKAHSSFPAGGRGKDLLSLTIKSMIVPRLKPCRMRLAEYAAARLWPKKNRTGRKGVRT
jgi:hypothetical protein